MTEILPTSTFNKDPSPLETKESGQQSSFRVASRWRRLFWNKGVDNALDRENEVLGKKRNKLEGGKIIVAWLRGAAARQATRLRINRRQRETTQTKENYDRYISALSMAQYALNLSVHYETQHERHLGAKGQA